MEPTFKKEERLVLVENVAIQIRNAIRSGKLKPGDRIIENELAKAMGISRFPIREAIRYLEKEGLVSTTPFKGAHVTKMTADDLDQIYSLRIVLEELAIRTLVAKLDDGKIAHLGKVVEAMKATDSKADIGEVIDIDLKFHQIICELSEHRRLLDTWLTLSNQLRAFIAMDDNRLYGSDTPEKTLSLHYPIFEFIKGGDADKAVAEMKKIITRGYDNAMKYYG